MNAPVMRAKMIVAAVGGAVTDGKGYQTLSLHAVSKDGGYPADGSDEDNSYARWTPQADLSMTIQNPALFDQFAVGDKLYVDFTKAE